MTSKRALLNETFHRLFRFYGPQGWWPAENQFEMMLGAVLTQNTTWQNAEKALSKLRSTGHLTLQSVLELEESDLGSMIRSSGFYNNKTKTLKALALYFKNIGGNFKDFKIEEMGDLRRDLLSIIGIGEETADDIILYAAKLPSFVIDAYTIRILERLGITPKSKRYREYKKLMEENLDTDVKLWSEYHALFDIHAKGICTKNNPRCELCCLFDICEFYKQPRST